MIMDSDHDTLVKANKRESFIAKRVAMLGLISSRKKSREPGVAGWIYLVALS